MHIPITLVASERSGSNLLRTLIGKHKNICAPIAPHLMTEFYDVRRYYGDLREQNNSYELLEDMLKIANHPHHDWKLDVDLNQLSGKVKSVIQARDLLYLKKSKQDGKSHYCSKGINAFSFIDPLRAELKNIKFIYLVRDPRDHVASWMRRPIDIFSPYDAILKWKSEQECMIDAITTKSMECLLVKYEDLIENTENTMTTVLEHIGIEIDPNCFSTDKKNKESNRNPYWENLSKPIMRNNKGKYRQQLSKENILIIESIAKNEMKYFGYDFCTKADWNPGNDFHLNLDRSRKIKMKLSSDIMKNSMGSLSSKSFLSKEIKAKRKKCWESINAKNKVYLSASQQYSIKRKIINSFKNRARCATNIFFKK